MNVIQNNHHTKLKGDMAVLTVAAALATRGYFVSSPLTEHAPYDLIVDCGTLLKVQVKYRQDGILPKKNSWSDKHGTHSVAIDVSKFDFFALVGEDGQIAYCPSKMAGMTIAFRHPTSITRYYWWEDFKDFSNVIPPKRCIKDDPDVFLSSKLKAQEIEHRNLGVIWPSDDALVEMILSMSIPEAASKIGVNVRSLHKTLKRKGIVKTDLMRARQDSNLRPSV